jgi:hypothetical protein
MPYVAMTRQKVKQHKYGKRETLMMYQTGWDKYFAIKLTNVPINDWNF